MKISEMIEQEVSELYPFVSSDWEPIRQAFLRVATVAATEAVRHYQDNFDIENERWREITVQVVLGAEDSKK